MAGTRNIILHLLHPEVNKPCLSRQGFLFYTMHGDGMFDNQKFIEAIREVIRDVVSEAVREEITKQPGRSEYLDEGEVADFLGYSKRSVRELRKTGAIPFAQFGRRILINRADLEAFISQHTIKKGRLLRRPHRGQTTNG